ncbi:MAG: hypothetical protein ACRDAX_05795 [Propionibacteriaceae bacterium]
MSTTIEVYPTTDVLPLVVETASRAEALFNELLSRHGIVPEVKIEPYYYPASVADAIRRVEFGVRWSTGLELEFHYRLHGEDRGNSFPACVVFEEEDQICQDDLLGNGKSPSVGYDQRFLGQWAVIADLADEMIEPELIAKAARSQHYWYECRSAVSGAVASAGYGFVAAALAEQTGGLIASWDCAFDEPNGQTAEQFLLWWGEKQISWYGLDTFYPRSKTE